MTGSLLVCSPSVWVEGCHGCSRIGCWEGGWQGRQLAVCGSARPVGKCMRRCGHVLQSLGCSAMWLHGSEELARLQAGSTGHLQQPHTICNARQLAGVCLVLLLPECMLSCRLPL